jgi:taurine transport system substrate-binding protein
MTTRFGHIILTIAGLALAGCAGSLPILSPSSGGGVVIRVAFPTEADAGDVPVLMALDRLRADGYDVQTTFFAMPELSVAAMAGGEQDLGNGSTRTYWTGVAEGAELLTVMEQTADLWSLVTVPELVTCRDLEGQRMAVNSAGSISNALLAAYVNLNCPDVQPNVLFVSGSDNRMAALEAGEIEGALLELADFQDLERRAPGRFHALIDYAEALPELKTTGIHVSRAFAQQHPEAVRDYVRAVLAVHREIDADPQLIAEALRAHLGLDAEAASAIAESYVSRKLWDVNGGLTRDSVAYSVEFFTTAGSLPAGLTAEDVADLSFLDAVLDEIGRR